MVDRGDLNPQQSGDVTRTIPLFFLAFNPYLGLVC
jgi:hypothetical protein